MTSFQKKTTTNTKTQTNESLAPQKKIQREIIGITLTTVIIKMAMGMIMMLVTIMMIKKNEDETRLGDLIVFSICLAVSLACRREIARD